MKKNFTCSLALAALLAATSGFAAAQEQPLVGYVSPIASQPGQALANSVMEDIAAEAGWDYRLLDANLSPDRQVSHVDTLLTLGADALASWSLDPNAVAAAYTRANEQGVPVVGVNSEGQGVTMSVWWEVNLCGDESTYDEHAAWIAERRPEGKVIVFGGPPVPSIQQNTACFVAAAENAGLEVLERVDNTKDSTANAATMAADLLVRHPEADVFWAYNDSSALGIAASTVAAGKTIYNAEGSDGVMIFGINGDSEAIDAIRAGRLTGTWDPDTGGMGAAIMLAFETLLDSPEAEHDDLIVESQFVTYANVEDYVPSAEREYSLDNVPLVE